MQLTNTLTRNKERFKPLKEEKVKVYYCWPTPYNFVHIGNLRAYLFEDMVVRTLRFLGYKIETTMNLTDIDDKTIRESIAQNISLLELTRKYSDLFLQDLEKLNIIKADNISPISELIPEMILMINWLLEKWYAYLAEDGSIYYSISKFKNYWQLAHLDVKWMKSSVRINNDEYEKEEVADFALWKAHDEVKDWPNKWEGKFNVIANDKQETDSWINKNNNLKTKDYELKTIWWRPGWHIECSACNLKFFGAQIDLHMWAIDNIFPHHQNEIAQTEAYTWKTFSKYWMHAGHLLVDNIKMSKSKNNFYTLRDIEDKMKSNHKLTDIYRWFRLMNLQAKYSDNFNFTYDKLTQSVTTLKNFDEVFRRIKNYNPISGKFKNEVSNNIQYFIQNFIECLEDDFATPEALASIFEFIKYVNSWIDSSLFTAEEISSVIWLFRTFDQVLGIMDFRILEKTEEIPAEISELLNKRNQAKTDKDYALSDEIRKQIEEKWYVVKDSKNWSYVEKIFTK